MSFENFKDAEASYDAQIESLLKNDYESYLRTIGNRESLLKTVVNHSSAWDWGVESDDSLFALLPNRTFCASQAEYEDVEDDLVDKVLKNKTVVLPNMDEIAEDKEDSFRFTRAELLEFKRRQLVARFS